MLIHSSGGSTLLEHKSEKTNALSNFVVYNLIDKQILTYQTKKYIYNILDIFPLISHNRIILSYTFRLVQLGTVLGCILAQWTRRGCLKIEINFYFETAPCYKISSGKPLSRSSLMATLFNSRLRLSLKDWVSFNLNHKVRFCEV